MNSLIETDQSLLIIAFIIQLFAIPFVFYKNEKSSLLFSNIVLLIGLSIGLISTLSSTLFTSNQILVKSSFANFIRLDGLSLYFLFIIQLIAIPTTIYNIKYLEHYIEKKRRIKNFLVFYIVLMISTQVIVIADRKSTRLNSSHT